MCGQRKRQTEREEATEGRSGMRDANGKKKGWWYFFRRSSFILEAEDGINLLAAVFLLLHIHPPAIISPCLHRHRCPPSERKNTLIPSGCRKSNSCCVVSPLLPTPSPFCQLQLSPTADCEQCGSFYLFVCVSVSAKVPFFHE